MIENNRAPLDELKGVWRSLGYNIILDISKKGFVKYDISKVSCVESEKGTLSEFRKLFYRIGQFQEDKITLYTREGVTRYTFEKLKDLPEPCKNVVAAKANDPEYNFEAFWHNFDENYAFFRLREVDWDKVYETYRLKVTSKTTDDELLEIFSEILCLLNDHHVGLRAGDKTIRSGKPHALMRQLFQEFKTEDYSELRDKARNKLRMFIQNDVLKGVFKSAANDLLLWGKIEPNIGYLNILSMYGFAGEEAPPTEQFAALGKAMDKVMDDFKYVDAAILDVRFNPGGFDPASMLIANRFADKKRLAFSKKAVHGDSYTETQEIFVHPEGDFQFTGPTVLLTSEATESAAEIFTLSLMGYPHVTRIGGNTLGILSDVLSKKLPNGWEVGLSNEIYTASDGNLYEKTGIPAHIEVPVFIPTYFYNGLKIAVDKAVYFLRDKLIASGKLAQPSIDEFISRTMDLLHFPGLAACIIKKERIVWSKGYGWANIVQKIPMSPDTLMNIGSISKTIINTAIMQLWERGNFKLDDNINNHLPFEVKNPFHPDKKITFRQLLTHTSSIKDGPAYEESYSCGDPVISLKVWLKDYLKPGRAYYNKKDNFHSWKPGERYDYSNIGFGLLGYLVEAISGITLGDHCKSKIFEPLGMEETSWYLSDLDLSKHAVPYTYVSKGEVRGRIIKEHDDTQRVQKREGYISNCLYSFPNFPDGLLRTSVNQLANFLIAYINRGSYKGMRLLQEDTLKEIFSSQLVRSQLLSRSRIQGLTWYAQKLNDKDLVWGYSGGDPGITTQMLFRPTDNVGVIVFTNTGWGYGIMEIAKRLFQETELF